MLVIRAVGVHPDPSRTRQLSPPAPMVVCGSTACESRPLPTYSLFSISTFLRFYAPVIVRVAMVLLAAAIGAMIA